MSAQDKIQQWGYTCGSEGEAQALVWPVRFKPGFTFALVLAGLLFKQPFFLMAAGLLGIIGSFVPRLSWIDGIYNRIVRPLFKSPALGADPLLRRIVCGLADIFIWGAGYAVFEGKLLPAWILGGLVLLLSGIVVLSGICLPLYLIYNVSKRSPYP